MAFRGNVTELATNADRSNRTNNSNSPFVSLRSSLAHTPLFITPLQLGIFPSISFSFPRHNTNYIRIFLLFFFFAKSFTSQPNDIEIFIPKEKCISFLNERIRKLRKSKEKSKESNGLGLYYKENVASGHRVEIVVSNINDFNLNRTFETIFSYDFREQRFATFASRLDPCVFVRLTFRIPDTFAPVYLPCFRAKIDRSLFFTGIFSRGKKETFAK